MPLPVHAILGLFRVRGAAAYHAEAVSPLEHALQCAHLAEHAGAPPEMVAACLLHDLGHLLVERSRETRRDADDLHQYHPLPFLHGVFPDAVLAPIKLHVEAKRYLCHANPGYRDSLTPASQRSLGLQGGPHTALEARMFLARPYADDAVRLRRWDDLAKVPRKPTPDLEHYAPVLQRCAIHPYASRTLWT